MSSIRKCLKTFFKAAHPDVLSHAAPEARAVNTRALQELNAYIDRLESAEQDISPTLSKDLHFFRKVTTKSGKTLTAVRPCLVKLPSIPPGADFFAKENITVKLIFDLEQAVSSESNMFSRRAPFAEFVEPIIASRSSHGEAREKFAELWEVQTKQIQTKLALEEDLPAARRKAAKKAVFNAHVIRLTRKYESIKNPRIRRMKLASIKEKSLKHVNEKFGHDPLLQFKEESDQSASNKLDIISIGYHPDLVFFDPSLSQSERAEGINVVQGGLLKCKEDRWLLENVWKVMRSGDIPVPIVLGRLFSADTTKGLVTVPYNFVLTELVDFLEDNLDDVRAHRSKLIKDAS